MTQEMTAIPEITPAAPAPTPAPAPAPAPAPTSDHWIETISDPALKDFAINKGYHKAKVEDVVRSYQNLEKLMGAEKAGRTIEVPDFDNPEATAARDTFFSRIGRPTTGKEYDLGFTAEEGVDAAFDQWARDVFHKNGLTAKQANEIGKAWVQFATQTNQEDSMAATQRAQQEDAILRQHWGAAYDTQVAKASAAAKAFGVSPEAIDAMQSVMGYGEVMQHFANIAEAMGEHQFISTDSAAVMTPYDAQAELNKFYNDKELNTAWMTKNHPRHKEAVDKHAYLIAMKNGIK